jgi:hypothetical protein
VGLGGVQSIELEVQSSSELDLIDLAGEDQSIGLLGQSTGGLVFVEDQSRVGVGLVVQSRGLSVVLQDRCNPCE